MNLDNRKIDELFQKFSTKSGDSNIMTKNDFTRAIQDITDKSNMLENPEYISLPELRNELGIVAHVSSLITMNIEGSLSDEKLIPLLKKSSETLKKSLKKLTKK